MSETTRLERTVIWRRLDGSSMEHGRFSTEGRDQVVRGVVIGAGGGPWLIDYEIRCDPGWRTRTATVRVRTGVDERTLSLAADEGGSWTLDGAPRGDLLGCVDVDLGFTPSTNTLPIRRLRVDAGESVVVDAAWVAFPDVRVERVSQRYTRLDAATYRYESLATGFSAELTVDAQGLVTSYPPGWEHVAPAGLASPLLAERPSAELGEVADLYRGLIGRWDVEVIDYGDDGERRTSEGEWHFSWALGGSAIQDVFIAPRRSRRTAADSRERNRWGTTVRYFDRTRQAWRIVWVNPVSGALNTLVARKEGDGIVQEGVDDRGVLMRWSFLEIVRDRFHWLGEESTDDGASWRIRAEFFGRRASLSPLR